MVAWSTLRGSASTRCLSIFYRRLPADWTCAAVRDNQSLVFGLWLHRSCICGCVVAVSSLRSRVHSPSLCCPLVPCPLPSRTHLAPTYSRHEWLPRRVTASWLGASFGAVEGLVLPHALAARKRTDHPKRAKSTSGHIALARDSGSAPVVGCGLHWSALLAWGVAWCERRVRTQVLW